MPTIINGLTGIDKIQNGIINSDDIAAGSVSETKLASNAVTTTKIADGSVALSKITPSGTSGQVLTSAGTGSAPTWADTIPAGLGVGQTWNDMVGVRAAGTTYTNSTTKPISVLITSAGGGSSGMTAVVGGISIQNAQTNESNGTTREGFTNSMSFIVPANSTYSVSLNSGTITKWFELR